MKRKKTQGFGYVWLILLVIAVGIVVSVIYFYQSVKIQLFTERQSHLTEMTLKISEVIDVTIETMQEKVDSAEIFVEQSGINEENAGELLEGLTDMLFIDNGVLYVMDNQGRYYSSEGDNGRWNYMEDLVTEDNVPVIRDIFIWGEKKSCMVFFAPLEDAIPMSADGSELTHVAVAVPLETLQEYLSISMFGDKCYTYLINQQGRRLYRQTFSTTFIEDINVISALKEDQFIMGGNIDDLIESVNIRERFSAEFREKGSGENYFVASVPVSGSDWTVLLFVPTDVLGVQTNQFMNSVIEFFLGIAGAGIAVFAVLFYIITTNRNDRKMLAQQQENNRLLEQAAEEARSANAAKSEFLAHMSHDIRTPINGIIGMTHIAGKNKEDPEKIEECLHKIDGAADHLLTLINDVLDMSAIESGKVVMAHEPLDIRLLINKCTSIIEGQIASRDLEFKKEYADLKKPFVYGDELHLRQIFINILGNAVKFTPDGGRIEFRMEETVLDEEKVKYRFQFEDTGIGMSEEFQKKIFDEFSQEDKGGRTNYQGTGLGMAIAKKFIELMGGTISVRSHQGEGSCFTVEILFDIAETPHTEVADKPKTQIHGMKVLLVEDNELNMEIAREILEEEGVVVTEAWDGQKAYETFLASKPGDFDVILMDIMMPVMNGYEAARAIRKSDHPMAKSIPIIAMTANAYREDVEKALEAGMNAHVAKPIHIDLLMTVLEQYHDGT
jgi:signal transduction histidine kinase/CheY-like chemotaxis protein